PRRPQKLNLFPYTTLFRSKNDHAMEKAGRGRPDFDRDDDGTAGTGAGAQDRPVGGAQRARSALSQSRPQQSDRLYDLRHADPAEREPEAGAGPRRELEAAQRDDLGIQAAQGREVP